MPIMERNNLNQVKESSESVDVYENWEMAEIRVERSWFNWTERKYDAVGIPSVGVQLPLHFKN